ncbi:MAG: hypothetical protein KUF79_17325 [Candidatus Thiodiazotropha sp. (ex Ctena orbiculata)]|nr:hypothetical protein [Candidatus Thiodiazotropha taylori]
MGLWGSLFAAPEILSKGTDAVIKAGDALVFTEEERSRANLKVLEWTLKYHEASKGSNLARRLLAIMVVGVFLFLILAVAFLYVVGADLMAAKLFGLVSNTLDWPVTTIIAFYFTSGMVKEVVANRAGKG